ncbi:FecR family protein [Legionella erythra]|uniref:FecR protein n=1 Tax=Legionella erythra TaxID=448 RepID=A0A0W0TG66_LEGER|nr:FecR family protein [Legionella erythra]KTC94563.1 FecR protein [Legionella erythra]
MKKLLFFCLLGQAFAAYAQQAIGTVLFASNQVTVERNNQKLPLTRGASFYVGDTIVTGANAQAQIRYSNGTLVALQPNSTYEITSYTPQSKGIQSQANLKSGGVESTTKSQKKAILKTPVIALAISGTSYRAMVVKSPTSEKRCKNNRNLKATRVATQVYQGQVTMGDTRLGPKEKYKSATYDCVSGQVTPGYISWGALGWVVSAASKVEPALMAIDVIGQLVPSNVIDTAVESPLGPTLTITPDFPPFFAT